MTSRRRAGILMVIDAASWFLAIVIAVLLRYDMTITGIDVNSMIKVACVAAVLQVITGWAFGTYSGRHRLGSYQELVSLGLACIPPAVVLVIWLSVADPRPVALSVPVIALPLAMVGELAARAVLRAVRDRRRPTQVKKSPTIVFGAGETAEQLVRSMNRSPDSSYRAVALLDDNTGRRNRVVDGVPVVGTRRDLERVARQHAATRLVIAVPSAGPRLLSSLEDSARAAGLHTYVVPQIDELIGRPSTAGELRELTEEDILGRRPIRTDLTAIGHLLADRRILVTGAGGSIGSELCRQIAGFHPARLFMLDRDESALHAVQLSITGRALLEGDDLVLADIRDADRMQAVMCEIRPDVVFHAAALKHLSLLEVNPDEAWKTNVIGTLNVLRAARGCGVDRFINISTDKAANPISVLGYSKRMTERLTTEVGSEALGTYSSVRFGNVLGSRGSMLTTFRTQIEAGGPVTVTDRDVTRYFMTIPEAVQLVLQSASIASDGEVLVLDMGDPVRIDDVVRRLIERSGREVPIVYTGLRTGEKLHEDLLGDGELDRRPRHPLITQTEAPGLPEEWVTAEATETRERMKVLAAWPASASGTLVTTEAQRPKQSATPAAE